MSVIEELHIPAHTKRTSSMNSQFPSTSTCPPVLHVLLVLSHGRHGVLLRAEHDVRLPARPAVRAEANANVLSVRHGTEPLAK